MERLTIGARVSATAKEKEKEKERGGPARGELNGPAGLAGPKGEPGKVFFFFLFQTSF
jgi:hypothetical protein